MNPDDENIELRRITILERNAEYYDAAELCFALFQRTKNPEISIRGIENLTNSAWQANSIQEMKANLSDLISRIEKALDSAILNQDQFSYLQAVSLEAEGWFADPPDSQKFIQAIELLIQLGKLTQALNLITSMVAFIEPTQQVYWAKYGIELTKQLSLEPKEAYFLLLIEPLLHYAEGDEKNELLQLVFLRTQELSQILDRSHVGNIAVLKGVDLIHPYRIEPKQANQIRQDNTHELVRSNSTVTDNRVKGVILSLLGSSYYRMAESEQDSELRQELYKKAKDHFLQSVTVLERTPAYGELLNAYTLAGTGFLSIAELERDFQQRNEFYRLGEEHLRKSRSIGEMTQLFQLRARAAINLGVALERVAWFDMNPERRKEKLMEIYNLQLEGRDLAEKTKELRAAGYATMNASEMCGFLSDLETRNDKKRDWAIRQRDLSQKGWALLEQTKDVRGQIVALSYAAFACAKLADLTPGVEEKKALYNEMLEYGDRAIKWVDEVPDPVATAYAYQQVGNAALHLGILLGDLELLKKASLSYNNAVEDWSKTGEQHKQAQAITQQADVLLFQSSLDFTPSEDERLELLNQSERLHKQAADLFAKLFFFHDVGENYWRIGQIHLLRSDYHGAQEYFDKVQKAFDQVAEIVPYLADVYSIFSTFGITFVGLIDGLNIISRGNYSHAALLFKELAAGLSHGTDRSLRQLSQLLAALTSICQYAATNNDAERETAKTELNRLLSQLNPDTFEQLLPYGLHKTIHRLQIFLIAPKLFFPALLLDLPLKDKMISMVQTRHIVSTAFNLYKSTAIQRDTSTKDPSDDVIRSYVERISSIITER